MDNKIPPELEIQTNDIVASALKASLGALPIVGPLMVELVGHTIPNQRYDRIVKYCAELEKKFGDIDESIIKLALQDENFTDLLEESLRQSVRSLSNERREYIASIIANSLTQEKIEYIESKHILRILGEINDIEVIWLCFYAYRFQNGDDEFQQKHDKILKYNHAHYNSPQQVRDKETFQKSYRDHLIQLDLLKPEYKSVRYDSSNELAMIDKASKNLSLLRYDITPLGKLLLQQIGLNSDC